MRLLHTLHLELRCFTGPTWKLPPYVILSHTWGEDEVTYDDFKKPRAQLKEMKAFEKIKRSCERAQEDGFEWIWIDTCCIDKRSSAELSEAINSMYQWYWEAEICYAFLADVTGAQRGNVTSFVNSRWFTRGWTLQELLAPATVEFFDGMWQPIGTKTSLLDSIHRTTRINKDYLLDRGRIQQASVATKFSWASTRQTTRPEDIAYCLLGLVSVNMPMLYGEGTKAFYRLQLEIVKQNNDQTIFVWEHSYLGPFPIFAPSPTCFVNSSDIRKLRDEHLKLPARQITHEITNSMLKISLPVCDIGPNEVLAVLNCTDATGSCVGIYLLRTDLGPWYLWNPNSIRTLTAEDCGRAIVREMVICAGEPSPSAWPGSRHPYRMRMKPIEKIYLRESISVEGHSVVGYRTCIGGAGTGRRYNEPMIDIAEGEMECLSLHLGFAALGLLHGQPMLRLSSAKESFPDFVFAARTEFVGQHYFAVTSEKNVQRFGTDRAELVKLHCKDGGWVRETAVLEAKKKRDDGGLWWVVDYKIHEERLDA